MAPNRNPTVLAMVLAGGKGERLMPLTAHRTKPAIPFAGKFRIVDFVLSNFLNSGYQAVYVLVQYRSQSLIEHLRRAWRISGRIQRNFITVVPPQMRTIGKWYSGTADAVYQNLNLVHDYNPDLVAVFGADHIYRMDLRQMVDFHLRKRADVTVAALPVPVEKAKGFGIIQADERHRIIGFEEKPPEPKSMPDDPEKAYSSMGNYLFNADVLAQLLEEDATDPSSHDFGRDILPKIVKTHRLFAYNFLKNEVPGIQPFEERGYWRDVGTLEGYWQAHMDLLGETPIFDLWNRSWPIMADNYDGPPAHFSQSNISDSMIAEGNRITEAEITRSVIGRRTRIGPGTQIEECIILGGATIGEKVRLRRVILDRFSTVPDGMEIGFPPGDKPGGGEKPQLTVVPRASSAADWI
ncbi:MAG TPA: glucose-1-phosphate adenylyltransferase [Nitrospiria bacterium]